MSSNRSDYKIKNIRLWRERERGCKSKGWSECPAVLLFFAKRIIINIHHHTFLSQESTSPPKGAEAPLGQGLGQEDDLPAHKLQRVHLEGGVGEGELLGEAVRGQRVALQSEREAVQQTARRPCRMGDGRERRERRRRRKWGLAMAVGGKVVGSEKANTKHQKSRVFTCATNQRLPIKTREWGETLRGKTWEVLS